MRSRRPGWRPQSSRRGRSRRNPRSRGPSTRTSIPDLFQSMPSGQHRRSRGAGGPSRQLPSCVRRLLVAFTGFSAVQPQFSTCRVHGKQSAEDRCPADRSLALLGSSLWCPGVKCSDLDGPMPHRDPVAQAMAGAGSSPSIRVVSIDQAQPRQLRPGAGRAGSSLGRATAFQPRNANRALDNGIKLTVVPWKRFRGQRPCPISNQLLRAVGSGCSSRSEADSAGARQSRVMPVQLVRGTP